MKKIVLNFCEILRLVKEISEYINIKSRQYISSKIIKSLIDESKLDYTNKNSTNAKNQKYITIRKGR